MRQRKIIEELGARVYELERREWERVQAALQKEADQQNKSPVSLIERYNLHRIQEEQRRKEAEQAEAKKKRESEMFMVDEAEMERMRKRRRKLFLD